VQAEKNVVKFGGQKIPSGIKAALYFLGTGCSEIFEKSQNF
jgi:hypothetical protein